MYLLVVFEGIEADCPRSPTSSTSTAPRSSTVYEYIDPKDVNIDTRCVILFWYIFYFMSVKEKVGGGWMGNGTKP